MDQIEDKIYLGSAYASRNKEKLKQFGITHILVVGAELETHHPKVSEISKSLRVYSRIDI